MSAPVDIEIRDDGQCVAVYATPARLREIADQLETRGAVEAQGTALDLDEPVYVNFHTPVEGD